MIAHIVLFSPKAGLRDDQILAFGQSAHSAFSSIQSVGRASVGKRIDVNPGYARSFGDSAYEYAAIVEFADEAGLIHYLTHPLHHELGRMFWEVSERTVVLEVRLTDGKNTEALQMLVR
jgi:hypothetical protein